MRSNAFWARIAVLAGIVVALADLSMAGQAPKPGGTLRVAFGSDIHSGRFTLNRSSPTGYETFWVMNNTHNVLVTLNHDFEIVPDLAKSWEVIDNGRAYIFHLHEHVKFHDGSEADAEAVKWNFDQLLAQGPKAWVYVYFTQIDSTEVVDQYTFKVTMNEPAELLQPLAGYFQGIPIGSPAAVKKWGDDWNRHPVGTGPYIFKFDAYRPDELIVLEKNPNYFRPGLPYLDRIEIRVLRDPIAAMTALRTGQIDFLQRVNPQHVPIMERATGVEVVTGPDRSPLVCLMNLRQPPFNDVRVRQAVGGYGMDRQQIVDTVFQGRTKALVSILPHGVQEHADLAEMYPYAPDKAKALLKEAGYDASHPLSFELMTNNDAPFFSDIAALFKSQMAKIGVQVNIVMMDKPAWLDRFLNKYDYQMVVEDFGALVDINQRSVSFFKGVRSNYMGMDSPPIEALTLQWRHTVDPAKRQEISAEMQRLFAQEMFWCNISGSPYFQAYRNYVKGYHFMNQVYVYWGTTWLDK